MTRLERTELNELSKDVLGGPNRWCKLKDNGVYENNTHVKKVRTGEIVWLTSFEAIKSHLLDLKAKKDKLLEEMKKSADAKVSGKA